MALSLSRYHQPRSRTEAKLNCAQLNEVVKWSRTVTAQGASWPLTPWHGGALVQSCVVASHRVALTRLSVVVGYAESGVGLGFAMACSFPAWEILDEVTPKHGVVTPVLSK